MTTTHATMSMPKSTIESPSASWPVTTTALTSRQVVTRYR